MPAYLIVNIEITDPQRYQEYVRVVPSTIERYGGRYLARGGRAEALEGSWQPRRLVVLEFPSFERAREWWASDDYAAPRALRQSASVADMVLVDGVS